LSGQGFWTCKEQPPKDGRYAQPTLQAWRAFLEPTLHALATPSAADTIKVMHQGCHAGMPRNVIAEKQMLQAVADARAFDSSSMILQPRTGQVCKVNGHNHCH
jgi:hypothetical protein